MTDDIEEALTPDLREKIRAAIWSTTGCSDSLANDAADAVLDVLAEAHADTIPIRDMKDLGDKG